LEKYKTTPNTKMTNQQNDEEQEVIIIDNIIQELDKKRKNAINKSKNHY
jgi:recombinational DNA repair ATPase RecF